MNLLGHMMASSFASPVDGTYQYELGDRVGFPAVVAHPALDETGQEAIFRSEVDLDDVSLAMSRVAVMSLEEIADHANRQELPETVAPIVSSIQLRRMLTGFEWVDAEHLRPRRFIEVWRHRRGLMLLPQDDDIETRVQAFRVDTFVDHDLDRESFGFSRVAVSAILGAPPTTDSLSSCEVRMHDSDDDYSLFCFGTGCAGECQPIHGPAVENSSAVRWLGCECVH